MILRALLLSLLLVAAGGCAGEDRPATALGGDPERGRILYTRYGCHTCHHLEVVRQSRAEVGPPLDRLGVRRYAGARLNTPDLLAAFLRDPRGVDPRSPMPDVGVTEVDARDLVAFLHAQR